MFQRDNQDIFPRSNISPKNLHDWLENPRWTKMYSISYWTWGILQCHVLREVAFNCWASGSGWWSEIHWCDTRTAWSQAGNLSELTTPLMTIIETSACQQKTEHFFNMMTFFQVTTTNSYYIDSDNHFIWVWWCFLVEIKKHGVMSYSNLMAIPRQYNMGEVDGCCCFMILSRIRNYYYQRAWGKARD